MIPRPTNLLIMGWRNTVVLFLLLALLASLLNTWQQSARKQGHVMIVDVVTGVTAQPVRRILLGMGNSAATAWEAVTRGQQLAEENARLRTRLGELEARLTQGGEGQAARQREHELRQAFPGRPRLLGRVVSIGGGSYPESVILDIGSNKGVRTRDVAIAAGGVAGQVVAVTSSTATVLLVTDPDSAVSIRLRRSREVGILRGLGSKGCELHDLSPNADVRVGDQVITSGLGGIFPAGLRIGSVVKVKKDPESPGKVAEIRLAADLRRMEELLLLRAGK